MIPLKGIFRPFFRLFIHPCPPPKQIGGGYQELLPQIQETFFLCVYEIFLLLLLQEHRQIYGNTREPLLENLTSEYDLELFRRAQARASEDLVSRAELIPFHVPAVNKPVILSSLQCMQICCKWIEPNQADGRKQS